MTNQSSPLSRLLNWNKKSAPETVDAEQYAEAFGQFKNLLLEQYQIRIQAKTAKRLPINLTAKPTHFGTSSERAALYFDDLTIESEDIATEIDKILNTHQRLLLIGEPGAGKTTILLFAAINILQDGNLGGNLKLPPKLDALPLILNLATWQKDRDFKEWYGQSIAHTYSLSPVFVEELLRRNAVVPFFDGFDEVAEDAREDCFQKMVAYFGDQRNRQLIVSSRKREYAAAESDAPVYAEIEVQPLSLEQIKKALKGNAQTQAADRALLDALDRDEHLARAVETPFYLNTASFLFGKGQRTLADFHFVADSVEGRQEELVKVFVTEQIPEQQDRKHLHFLAEKMEEENFLVFELVKMQPVWNGNVGAGFLSYELLIVLTLWFIFGLLELSGFRLSIFLFGSGSEIYSVLEIFGTLSSSILFGEHFFKPEIKTKDVQVWRWKTMLENWDWNIIDNDQVITSYTIVMFWVILTISVLLDNVFAGFIGGGVFVFIYILKNVGSTTNLLLYINKPYKRFWATFYKSISILFILFIAILSAHLALQAFSSKRAMDYKTASFLIHVPVVSITLYLLISSQFLKHFLIRLTLYLEQKLPLRLVTFLDRMTDQHIFEDNRRIINGKKQRGATWRFRHKILQDYFAGHP